MPRKDFDQVTSAHFRTVAADYDRGRGYEKVEFWVQEAARWARLGPGSSILDLGCGTGMFAIAFARLLSATVYGIDPSAEMLKVAREKNGGELVKWTEGRAEELPYADGSFHCVFASQVWHHLSDSRRAAGEVHRVLRPGGSLLVKTFSHAQLRAKPAFVFFPAMLPGQLTRYPDIGSLKELLRETGFATVLDCSHNWEEHQRLSDYVEAAEKRIYSMYSHLTEGEREEGLRKLRERLAKEGDVPVRNDDVNTLVVAVKGQQDVVQYARR